MVRIRARTCSQNTSLISWKQGNNITSQEAPENGFPWTSLHLYPPKIGLLLLWTALSYFLECRDRVLNFLYSSLQQHHQHTQPPRYWLWVPWHLYRCLILLVRAYSSSLTSHFSHLVLYENAWLCLRWKFINDLHDIENNLQKTGKCPCCDHDLHDFSVAAKVDQCHQGWVNKFLPGSEQVLQNSKFTFSTKINTVIRVSMNLKMHFLNRERTGDPNKSTNDFAHFWANKREGWCLSGNLHGRTDSSLWLW